jgi:SecD/SecF fusion protein
MTDRSRNFFILLVVLGLIVASAVVVALKPTREGLDLQGGVQLVYEARPTKAQPVVDAEGLDRALDIMRERVDSLGVAEPELLRSGSNQIEVNLPGVSDAARAERQVGDTAQMFFYDWEPNVLDADCKTNPDQVNGGQQPVAGLYNAVLRASKCPPQIDKNNTESGPQFYAFDKKTHAPLNGGIAESSREAVLNSLADAKVPAASADILSVPEGVVVLRNEDNRPANQRKVPIDQWWVIHDNPVLSGNEIKNPEQNFDQQSGNQPIVTMDFTSQGRKAFEDTTRTIAQRGQENAALNGGLQNPQAASFHFMIRLDNEIISTPFINFRENPDGIDGRNGAQISGGFTIQTAQDLARLLKTGALPLKLELVSRSQVSATLGKQALHQGLIAGLVGFGIVVIFLIGFYRVLGVVASGAMVVYSLYFFALVKLIPVTLTLPGIAGLILTLGVAADANIVIFERVKEELRAGRSVGAAIAQGYRKGFGTIVDANVVTLLVAFILFILATAGVKGFALMLGLGTIVSMLTAVLATQAILLSLRNSGPLRRPSALGAGKQKRPISFDFMGSSKWFFSVSGVILLACALAIAANGLNFGIDFKSGTRITAPLTKPASVDDVRSTLAGIGYGDAKIQTVKNEDLGQNVVQVSTETLQPSAVDRVNDRLRSEYGLADQPNVESIGPTFGNSVANSAIVAVIASLSVISIYIALRFEWKYAVPVLIALMHDILITAGVYALVGQEVTTSTVAALLTILGFSLYDTIIVFDRIRENVPRMPSAAFSQIVNRSMSEVVVRSVATSFCTGLPVLALLLFGGDTLKDFAFALFVGIASGAYSSIFIAGPVLTHWKEREPLYRARQRRITAQFGAVPAYAVAAGGTPVDVEPARNAPARVSSAPTEPGEVSRAEFDEMVRNLGIDAEPQPVAPARGHGAGGQRPSGGRRARGRAGQDGPGGPAAGGPGSGPAGPAAGGPAAGERAPEPPRPGRRARPRPRPEDAAPPEPGEAGPDATPDGDPSADADGPGEGTQRPLGGRRARNRRHGRPR